MFQVPSISEIEDEENAVVSAFASRHKQSGQSKSEARSVDADSSDGSHVRASNFSGRSEMTSSENALSIDYKQIVNAAPVVSEKLKKAIAASNAQNDDSVSAPSKDLFNIRENNESKVGNTLAQPPITRNYSGSTIYAINRQKGNPILKHIRNVPIEFVCDIAPDYILSEITCALFLSLRYHHLNPNYIYDRIRKVGSAFKLRLLLLEIDVIDPSQSLAELNKACFHADFTLLLAFSSQEAGRYLETYKVYQFKPVDLLRANIETDPTSRAIDFLTTIKVRFLSIGLCSDYSRKKGRNYGIWIRSL